MKSNKFGLKFILLISICLFEAREIIIAQNTDPIPSNIFNVPKNYPDAGLWNTFNIEYEINNRFKGLFTEELRLKENFSRLNLLYTNVGLEYKISNHFKAALIYRFINKFQDDNSFSYRNRLMLDLTGKKKHNKFILAFRQRFQVEKKDIYSSDDGNLNEWYARSKFTLKYDLDKPYTPYASVEVRYQLYNLRKQESDGIFHRARYILGVDYKFNNKNTFGVYYLIQHEWDVLKPQSQYIIGLEYTLSF